MANQSAPARLDGKTAVVTGASNGIGREIARGLAALGARVVLAVRDEARGRDARDDVARSTGNEALEVALVDLARPASVRDFARDLLARHPRIDVLVDNAGVHVPRREVTVDGVERTWATNVVAYHLVVQLLEPAFVRGTRVVVVASTYAGGLDLDDPEFARRPYDGAGAYAASKQADRMLAWWWARRLDGKGVTVNAMHPGAVATNLLASMMGGRFGRSPAEGADTAVWLAASPSLDGRSGRFFADRRERPCEFRDDEAEGRLVDLLARYTTPVAIRR